MMVDRSLLLSVVVRNVLRTTRAAAAVEFALLAPLFFGLLFGVLQVGIYLQNYNAVQSVASDGVRIVMIEYQKGNELSDEQIRSVILARAVNAPYLLDTDRLIVNVDRSDDSRISGATEIEIEIGYTLADFVPGYELPGSTIRYERSIFVVS